MAYAKTTEAIEVYRPQAEHFLRQTTNIYGLTGGGKSTVITDILYTLRNDVSQCVIISPTDAQNRTYTRGDCIPSAVVHYQLNNELLENITKRQSALASAYTMSCNIDLLKKIANYYSPQTLADVEGIEMSRRQMLTSVKTDQIKDTNDRFDKLVVDTLRARLRDIRIGHEGLDDNEYSAALFIKSKPPHMALVFDDCTSELTELSRTKDGKSLLGNIYSRGRWDYFTIITACHDDTALPTVAKTNAYINIFCDSAVVNRYFGHASSGVDRDTTERALRTFQALPAPNGKKRYKMVYIRQRNTYYQYLADEHPEFHFGGPAFRKYCEAVQKNGAMCAPADNDYFRGLAHI